MYPHFVHDGQLLTLYDIGCDELLCQVRARLVKPFTHNSQTDHNWATEYFKCGEPITSTLVLWTWKGWAQQLEEPV